MATKYRNPRPQPARFRSQRIADPKVDHDLDVAKQEAVEMYAAVVTAWFGTAMEFDRALVTLGAGALALLIGLATTGTNELSTLDANVFSAALLFFLISLASTLLVFKLNKGYLEEMAQKRADARTSHPWLRLLDWVGMLSFGIGALLSMYVGVAAIQKKSVPSENITMSDKAKIVPKTPAFDSVNGAMNLNTFGKSFNGATALIPKVSTPAPTPTSSAPASAPVASAPVKTSK